MSKARTGPLITHLLVAVLVSYGLSAFFWLGLGVFNLMGFVIISALAAILGVSTGWVMGKRLWITATASLAYRLALYGLMMRGL